jgi:hypothetical protein
VRRWTRVALPTLILSSLVTLFWARGSQSVPLYATRTGLMCGSCHFDPNGGGPRNEFGFAFARNRHRLEPEDSTSTWHDLSVVNKIGESMPVFIGLNQRFMLLADDTGAYDNLDRIGFFNMENALYLTVQPHPKLTLVYSRDGFDATAITQDAFGMISGGPWSSYFKAGRFRTPFGLRMDDHTVATRAAFLDFQGGQMFLPYDPRFPDEGFEIGAEKGSVFGRASFTNGQSSPFAPQGRAQAKTLKLGYHNSWFQGGASIYDDFRGDGNLAPRATRWGYYQLTRLGPVDFIGEIAAGTDEFSQAVSPAHKNNLIAGYGELDYAPVRWINFRTRYDHIELSSSEDWLTWSTNAFDRYALEGEWVPVPFAEIRWTIRHIVPRYTSPDETQEYVQLHFSY